MAARNDVTGDEIKSKSNSKKYAENWEAIFGKKNKEKSKDATKETNK